MTPLLELAIPGAPVGAARPRVTRNGTYLPKTHQVWERTAVTLARAAWRRPALDEPVAVYLRIWHSRPERLRTDPRTAIRATCKPDVDNVAKLVLDALTKAGVFVDDTRVAVLHAERWYLPLEGEERDQIEVVVYRLDEPRPS